MTPDSNMRSVAIALVAAAVIAAGVHLLWKIGEPPEPLVTEHVDPPVPKTPLPVAPAATKKGESPPPKPMVARDKAPPPAPQVEPPPDDDGKPAAEDVRGAIDRARKVLGLDRATSRYLRRLYIALERERKSWLADVAAQEMSEDELRAKAEERMAAADNEARRLLGDKYYDFDQLTATARRTWLDQAHRNDR